MTGPTRSDELLRRMLERRAEASPPAWLLPGIGQAVRAAPQARRGQGHAWRLPRRRSERLVLGAAAAMLLLALVLGTLVAGRMIDRTPKPPLPADVVAPSPSTSGSSDTPSEAPSGSPSASAPSAVSTHATSPAVPGSAWALPTGWRYELDCDDDSRCFLSLYDATDGVQDGWPVAMPGDCAGSDVAVGPESSAFIACTRTGRAVVSGLDRHGQALPGWPVSLKGEAAWSTWNDFRGVYGTHSIAVGPDATVYVAAAPSGEGSYAIHALAPDGRDRVGWPVVIGGGGQGFAVAHDGTLVAWWYEGYEEAIQLQARRTLFTEIGRDGEVLTGWPRGSTGAASGPVVSDDGNLFYVSASGKVWAHDRRGEIIDGWPYELAYPIAPSLRADGTFIFIDDSRVIVLDGHAKTVGHWPYRTKGTFMGAGCDTPSFPDPLASRAVDGTLYLASWDGTRSSVVGLRVDGTKADGWPYAVPVGWRVSELLVTHEGTIVALVGTDDCGGGLDAASFTLTASGTVLGDELPTPLNQVYKALRLEDLRTTSGKDSFVQGAAIEFAVRLVNRSSREVILPHVTYNDNSWYAAGSIQTWIEPLASGPPLTCLAGPDRKGQYATGGEISVSSNPVTIPVGGSMPAINEVLFPAMTGCLRPGTYRYRLEYKGLDDDPGEVIGVATFDFTVTPSTTVTPLPIPTPTPTDPPPKPTPPPPGPTVLPAAVTVIRSASVLSRSGRAPRVVPPAPRRPRSPRR